MRNSGIRSVERFDILLGDEQPGCVEIRADGRCGGGTRRRRKEACEGAGFIYEHFHVLISAIGQRRSDI